MFTGESVWVTSPTSLLKVLDNKVPDKERVNIVIFKARSNCEIERPQKKQE